MLTQIVECLGTFTLRATEGQLRRLPMATLAAKILHNPNKYPKPGNEWHYARIQTSCRMFSINCH